ncbi:MAG: hypothetical protein ACOY0T_16470 [Myxococcota bacterium]
MTIAPAVGFPESSSRVRRLDGLGEFMLVGGATLPLLALAYVLRTQLGLESSELVVGFVMFHAAHVLNDPHFAVTYLLFYRDVRERAFGNAFSRAQRLRYWFAGAVVPVVLGSWLVVALARHSAVKLGYAFQFMFLLVGWHYVKQGFGVVTVLSARRGFQFTSSERRVVLAHCISAWLFARANPRDPGREASSEGVLFTTIAHPPALDWITSVGFAVSTLALGWLLVQRWRRGFALPPLVPLAGFLITVWLWTAFSKLDPLLVYVIPALHSLQYLYFVWLLRRNPARDEAVPTFVGAGRALLLLTTGAMILGWLLFRGVPAWLDETLVLKDVFDPLGETPYFAAIASFVNIHHYFMDAVIWRRENPETRQLLA